METKIKEGRETGVGRCTYNLYGRGLSKPLSPFFLFILEVSMPVGGMKRSRAARLPGCSGGCGAFRGARAPWVPGPPTLTSRPLLDHSQPPPPGSCHTNEPFYRRSGLPTADILPVTSDPLRQRKWDRAKAGFGSLVLVSVGVACAAGGLTVFSLVSNSSKI